MDINPLTPAPSPSDGPGLPFGVSGDSPPGNFDFKPPGNPVPESAIPNRAARVDFALGDKSPGVPSIINTMRTDGEDPLRKQAMLNEQADYIQHKHDMMMSLIHNSPEGINPQEADFVNNLSLSEFQNYRNKDTILEQKFGEKVVRSVYASDPNQTLLKAEAINAEAAHGAMDIHENEATKQGMLAKEVEDVNDALAKQGYVSKALDIAADMVPFWGTFKLTNLVRRAPLTSLLPGNNMLEQVTYVRSIADPKEFQKTLHDAAMSIDNLQDREFFVNAIGAYSISDQAMSNIAGAADVGSVLSPAIKGLGKVSSKIASKIIPDIGQAAAIAGNTEAAANVAAARVINGIPLRDQQIIEQKASSIFNPTNWLTGNGSNLTRMNVNKFEKMVQDNISSIKDTLFNSPSVDRTSDAVRENLIPSLFKKMVGNGTDGLDNTVLDVNQEGKFTPRTPSSATTFETSQGSVYTVHEDGTTTRNKSLHQGHDPNDVGVKDRSHVTIYVDPAHASDLSGAGLITPPGHKGFRLVIHGDKDGGKATLLGWNTKEKRWGIAPGGADVPYTTIPQIGKSPVEGWKLTKDVLPGHDGYRSQHAGNPITKLTSGSEAKSAEGSQKAIEIQHNFLTNTDSMHIRIGKTNGEQFSNKLSAQKFAKDYLGNHQLTNDNFVNQDGKWHIRLDIDLPDNLEGYKDIIPETDRIKTSWLNRFIGGYRNQKNVLGDALGNARMVVAHGNQKLFNTFQKVTKPIADLNKTERVKLSAILEQNRDYVDYTDPSNPKRGQFYKSLGEFQSAYHDKWGSLPSDKQTRAYYAYIQANQLDGMIRNAGWLRDNIRLGLKDWTDGEFKFRGKAVSSFDYQSNEVAKPHEPLTPGQKTFIYKNRIYQGTEHSDAMSKAATVHGLKRFDQLEETGLDAHSFGYVDKHGNNVPDFDPEGPYNALKGIKELPKGNKERSSKPISIAVKNSESGEIHYFYDKDNLSSKQKELLDKELNNNAIIITPERGTVKAPGYEDRQGVTYYVSGTPKENRLSIDTAWKDGGHVINEHRFYIKQPQLEDGWFKKDLAFATAPNELVAKQRAGAIETARQMMLRHDPALDAFVSKSIGNGIDAASFKSNFFKGGFDPNLPFYHTPSGIQTVDYHKMEGVAPVRRHPHDLRQLDRAFSGERDPTNIVALIDEKDVKHIFQDGKLLDPFPALVRASKSMVDVKLKRDYILKSANLWSDQFQGLLKPSESQIGRDPLGQLYHPDWREHGDSDLKVQAENARKNILGFAGIRTEEDTMSDSFASRMSEIAYSALGEKKYTSVSNSFMIPLLKNPIQAAKSVAYKLKLGLFSVAQFPMQAQSLVTVLSVSNMGWKALPLYYSMRMGMISETLAEHGVSVARMLGYNGDHYREMQEALYRSGWQFAHGDMAILDAISAPKIFQGKLGKAIDAGDVFVTEGTRAHRLPAFAAAYYEWRGANPGEKLTRSVEHAILSRADDLSNNMSAASNAVWQKGPASIPAQFMTFPLRLAEGYLPGSRLTPKERIRMFAGYSLAYGIPTAAAGVVGVWPMYESVKYYLLNNDIPHDDNAVQAVLNGLPQTMIKMATGSNIDYGKRFGQGGVIEFRDFLYNSKPGWELATGAVGSVMGDIVSSSMPAIRGIWSALTDDPKDKTYPLDIQDIMHVFQNISSVDKGLKLWYALNTHRWMSKYDQPMDHVTNSEAFMMALTGANLESIDERFNIKEVLKGRHDQDSQTMIAIGDLFTRALRSDDQIQRRQYFTQAKALAVMNGLPIDKWSSTMKQTLTNFDIDEADKALLRLEKDSFKRNLTKGNF